MLDTARKICKTQQERLIKNKRGLIRRGDGRQASDRPGQGGDRWTGKARICEGPHEEERKMEEGYCEGAGSQSCRRNEREDGDRRDIVSGSTGDGKDEGVLR